jgi:putative drug exporter of the RND superfamily
VTLSRLADLPAGRRSKWVFVVGWLLLIGLGLTVAGRLEQAQTNNAETYLPAEAESVRALELRAEASGSDAIPTVVLYERPGGLTTEDLEAVEADRAALLADGEITLDGDLPPPIPAETGEAVQLFLPMGEGDGFEFSRELRAVRSLVGSDADGGARDDGLSVWVTGPGGVQGDLIEVFAAVDTTLLTATATIVTIVLLITFRSPVLWMLPLLSVAAAEISSRAGITLLAENAGLIVNGQSAAILSVLVFGAGTDYALLLVARYREELHVLGDRHEAMAVALRQAGPAVLASGGTVIAGLLCLLVADDAAVRGLGPVAAIGIAFAMAAMLTFLPALLVTVGRPVFWPFVPRKGDTHVQGQGAWRRLGERIARRPRRVGLATGAVLALLWLGVGTLDATGLTNEEGFRGTPESVAGQQALARHFPVGVAAPVNVLGPAEDAEVMTAVLRDDEGIAQVVPVPSNGGDLVQVDGILTDEPDGAEAGATIERLRSALDAAGSSAVVGGETALNLDIQQIAQRDRVVIIPLVLVVVLVIIIVLLRSITAPVLLLATTVISFGAALGLAALVFQHVYGIDSADSSLPLFAFIFLVALGIDYNIFLMTRVREESLRVGTRQGVLRGRAVTGGVITSAGVVLAATFSVLAVLPLTFTLQIGTVVALGVLLDALVVRSILVPAIVLDDGARVWWPSRLRHDEAAALHDDPERPDDPERSPPLVGSGAGARD